MSRIQSLAVRKIFYDPPVGVKVNLEFVSKTGIESSAASGFLAPLGERIEVRGDDTASFEAHGLATTNSPHPACGHLLPIGWGEGRDEGTKSNRPTTLNFCELSRGDETVIFCDTK